MLFPERNPKILAVFLLRKPSTEFVRHCLLSQNDQPFSYDRPGATREETAPADYHVDHNRLQLGRGALIFEQACEALRQWKMFDMRWVQLCWTNTPIEAHATVAVLISHAGFWSLNPSRIVYVIEDHRKCERYGFAYGTLPQHSERGEERFSVEFHRDDDSVWYDIYAFSRPRSWARLGYPYARMLQRRFARESMSAMKRAVE